MAESRMLNVYKSPSSHKRCNVYLHLLAREYETKSNHRRIHHITGTLITKGDCFLKRVWTRPSPQRINCDGRFAFFNNYQECFDFGQSPHGGKIQANFRLRREKREKILDAVIMDGVAESATLPFFGHRSSLLAVTKDCQLIRLDLETGKTLEQIALGPPSVKFKKINWNQTNSSVVISSVLFPRQDISFRQQARLPVTEVIQLVVLACLPLSFLCKMSVNRLIFGRDAVDASLSLDILSVMHSTSHIRMYSFTQILTQSKTHNDNLYDVMPGRSWFGSREYPVTHNVKIKTRLPCLFQIRCRDRDLMMTMPPCYYVMWPIGKAPGYCCYSFKTQEMVENGCLETVEDSFDQQIILHLDDSGRVLKISHSHLKMYRCEQVKGADEGRVGLVEDFTINFNLPPAGDTQTPPLTVSQSGRVIKKRQMQDSVQVPDQMVLSLRYDEDLDMMVILFLRRDTSVWDESGDRTVVGFYDNWNGRMLRQFELEGAPYEEVEERSFDYDCDGMTHTFKRLRGRMECHLYKFVMACHDGPQSCDQVRRSNSRQPSASRRARLHDR